MKVLRHSLKELIEKYPHGRDGVLFREIVHELIDRFDEKNLFKYKDEHYKKMGVRNLMELVGNIVGKCEKTEVLRLSTKLEKYDYHKDYAPKLYSELLRVEAEMLSIRRKLNPVITFFKINHREYFETLCEKVFKANSTDILNALDITDHSDECKKDVLRMFKKEFSRKVWPKYERVVLRIVDSIEKNPVNIIRDIEKYNGIRRILENRVYEMDYINKILGVEEVSLMEAVA